MANTMMDEQEFKRRMTALLPGVDSKAVQNLIRYAGELDKDNVCSKDNFFRETYVEFTLIKNNYEPEILRKLFDVCETFDISPFEIRGAANHLRDGTESEKIGFMAVEGYCERTEEEFQESKEALAVFENRAQLIERIDKNIGDFEKSDAFYNTALNDAMENAHYILSGYTDYTSGQLRLLLEFENPLSIIADRVKGVTPSVNDLAAHLRFMEDNTSLFRARYAVVTADGQTLIPPAQAALHEPDVSESSETAALFEKLDKKLFLNLTNYFESLQGQVSAALVDKSSEVAAMTTAYNYLTEIHNFHASELNYLLQFKEPLKVVAAEFEWAAATENLSDTMRNIFDKQEALTNGKHALVDAPPSFKAQQEQRLMDRLADNYSRFKRDRLASDKETIFYSAAEIHPIMESYEYFAHEHQYTESEVEFLLKFKNPLELISDRWSAASVVHDRIVEDVFAAQEWTLKKGGYALVPDEQTPVPPENARPVANADERPSTLDEIRRARKDMRERPATPKNDTLGRKKSEWDL